MFDLSMWRCSGELQTHVDAIWSKERVLDKNAIAEERKRRNYPDFWNPVSNREPYRCALAQVRHPQYCHRFSPAVQSHQLRLSFDLFTALTFDPKSAWAALAGCFHPTL